MVGLNPTSEQVTDAATLQRGFSFLTIEKSYTGRVASSERSLELKLVLRIAISLRTWPRIGQMSVVLLRATPAYAIS